MLKRSKQRPEWLGKALTVEITVKKILETISHKRYNKMLISKILSSLCLSNFSDMNLSLKLNKIILDKEKYFVEIYVKRF